jgi:hypothetical protein
MESSTKGRYGESFSTLIFSCLSKITYMNIQGENTKGESHSLSLSLSPPQQKKFLAKWLLYCACFYLAVELLASGNFFSLALVQRLENHSR